MNKKKFKLITFNKKQKANFAYKKKIIITDLLLNIIIGYHSFEKIIDKGPLIRGLSFI